MKAETVLILVAMFLAVYWQATFDVARRLVGAQPDLLPSLMVYVALSRGIMSVASTALIGGLLFDSLSANPLGLTAATLFAAGFAIYSCRDMVLRDQPFAQAVLGAGAGFGCSVLGLLTLLTLGYAPALGWGTLWQIAVVTAFAGISAPLWFICFGSLHRMLAYGQVQETVYRTDREIRRRR